MPQVRGNRTSTTTRRPGGAPLQPGPRTRPPKAAGYQSPKRASSGRLPTVVSALLILAGGYVHFCLYRHGYRFIPKIGFSFLLQSTSSALLAGALLFSGGRIRIARHFVPLAQLTRLLPSDSALARWPRLASPTLREVFSSSTNSDCGRRHRPSSRSSSSR